MSNISSKTHMVSFRLSLVAYSKILEALKAPSNGNTSVGDYCKQVVERHAFRHSTRKYKKERIINGNKNLEVKNNE